MAEDRGGLQYKIDASGNFDKVFERFIARVRELEAAIDTVERRIGSFSQGGAGSQGSRTGITSNAAKAAKQQRDYLEESAAVQRKLNALDAKEEVLLSERVTLRQAEVDQLGKQEKAVRKTLKADEAATQTMKDRQQIAKFLSDQAVHRAVVDEAAAKAEITRRNQIRKVQQAQYNDLAKEAKLRETIIAKDARRSVSEITKNESMARKQELADLKNSILERDRLAKQAAKERARIAKETVSPITDQKAVAIATERNLKASNELAVKKAQINQLVKEMGVSERRAAELVGVTSSQAKRLGLNMWDAEHAARQFLFTFRRLVGILFIFTLARKFAQAIGAAVREMVSFNAELETSEIAIASVLTSVGTIRDRTGRLLTGQEAFNAALAKSGQLVQELQKDAIGSIATFEALVQAYQVAVGPGLAAGLDPDQIKVLSKRLAEGAVSLGVPLNQLSEEIRSLLSGTATARNTRIAVLFGGAKEANEAVRLAKEQGNLFEVLMDKLNGVALGAITAASSMEVLKSNLEDAVRGVLKKGGVEYFEALKVAILGFRNAIGEVNTKNTLIFTPEALGLVRSVSDILTTILTSFREMTKANTVFSTLENTIALVGEALKVLAPIAAGIFQGILTGVNAVLAPLRAGFVLLRTVAEILGGKYILKYVTQIVGFLIAARIAIAGWAKVSALAAGIWAWISKTAFAANLQVTIMTASIGLFNAGLISANMLMTALSGTTSSVAAGITTATGGLNLLLVVIVGLVLFVLNKFGLIDKAMRAITGETGDAVSEVDKLTAAFSGNSDAVAEGVKTLKDWADALKDAKAAADVAEGISGVSGITKDILSLIEEETAEFGKQTEELQRGVDLAYKRKKVLEDELGVLQDKSGANDLFAGVRVQFLKPDTPEEAAARLIQTMQGIQGIEVPIDVVAGIDAGKTSDLMQGTVDKIAQKTAFIKQQEEKILETRKLSLGVLQERLRTLIAENTYLEEQKNLDVAEDAKRIAEAVNKRANVSVRAVATLKAEQAIMEAQTALNQRQRDVEAKKLALKIAEKQALVDSGKAELADITALTVLQEQQTRATELSAKAREAEEAEAKALTYELRKQQGLLENDLSVSLKAGLEDFYKELPSLGTQLAETITGALGDFASTVGSLFKDAIDPRTDANVGEAFGEFFLNLAGQFAEQLTQQLIAAGVQKLLVNTAANAASGEATGGGTEAQGITRLLTPLTGILSVLGIGQAKDAGFQATTLSILGGIYANSAALVIAATTDAVVPFKKGGMVKGYASGGDVNKLPRPSHIPASDTVPAWLTPGEFVVRKEMVKKYGVGILDALNKGILNPHSFSHAALSIGGRAKQIQHFATGGGVRQHETGRNTAPSSTVVLPVLPATNNTIDQLIAGGRTAFSRNLNKTPYVGDPNRSHNW